VKYGFGVSNSTSFHALSTSSSIMHPECFLALWKSFLCQKSSPQFCFALEFCLEAVQDVNRRTFSNLRRQANNESPQALAPSFKTTTILKHLLTKLDINVNLFNNHNSSLITTLVITVTTTLKSILPFNTTTSINFSQILFKLSTKDSKMPSLAERAVARNTKLFAGNTFISGQDLVESIILFYTPRVTPYLELNDSNLRLIGKSLWSHNRLQSRLVEYCSWLEVSI